MIYLFVYFFTFGGLFRRRALQRRVQEAQVSSEEEEIMMRNLEKRETEYMRLQRHKVGIDDFEQLTIIGKGAFGEVCCIFFTMNNFICSFEFCTLYLHLHDLVVCQREEVTCKRLFTVSVLEKWQEGFFFVFLLSYTPLFVC